MESGNEIKEHYSDEEILKITLNKELNDWKNELSFFEKELGFLKDLLSSVSHSKAEHTKKIKRLFGSLEDYIKENKILHDQTLNFSHKTMEIRECEDVECETYFFNEHFEFHKKLGAHLTRVRELKLDAFMILNERLKAN